LLSSGDWARDSLHRVRKEIGSAWTGKVPAKPTQTDDHGQPQDGADFAAGHSVLAVELDVEHLLQRRDHVADQSRPSIAVNGKGDSEAASARF
jgi:hypothetical protein